MRQTIRRRPLALSGVALIAMLAAACGDASDNGSADETEDTAATEDEGTDSEAAEGEGSGDGGLVAPVASMECDAGAEPSGDPIVVGGSLSLTGPLAQTASIHDAVANVVTQWVNECGGLLGRPLEWEVLDDQSTPEQASSNYERLINDGVDLVIGPYGGANILAAAGPVGRAGYVYPTHTNGVPDQEIGDTHFPSWQFGNGEEDAVFSTSGHTLYDAYASSGNTPETAFFATSKFPTTEALAAATREVFEAEGVEIVDMVEYDLGTTDFSSIALRIAAEDPDFIYVGGLAADAVNLFDAFEGAGYTPRGIHVALPAPATLPSIGDAAENMTVLSIYENHAPLSDDPVASEFADRFGAAAEENELFPVIETQAAASLGAWQILLAGVAETESVDNAEIQAYLNEAAVDTLAGEVTFDGFNNYGTDFNRITQIQGGERVLVWPEDLAGAELVYEP
ncbi:MAG: ABC transporter substrate-binding protein [Actinomycetota bacterium]